MTVKPQPRGRLIALSALGAVVVVALVAGIVVWQVVDWKKDELESPDDGYFIPPSNSVLGVYGKAAVVTDAPYCSDVGKGILEKGGTVADAAIASALCIGVIQTQSMGIGGGFLLVYYNASSKTSETLNARERAPNAAFEDMFDGDPEASSIGPRAIAVPGELKGYWMLWKKYGKMKWSDLFQPAIALCENGFNVTAHAANAMRSNRRMILSTPSLREVFYNNATQDVFKEGETMKRPVLAETLKIIAAGKEGEEDLLYRNTDLMRKFVEDIRNSGGIITEEDILTYNATWDPPVEKDIAGDYRIHSIPPPGSGVLLAFIMKLLSNYKLNLHNVVSFQRIVESFKHAYAKRTILGDPLDPEVADVVKELSKNLTSDEYIDGIMKLIHDDRTNNTYEYYGAEYFQPPDHGTAHLAVIGPNGDAVALTSTVNLYFGAKLRSRQTGIIFNDQMDDFSAPNITNSFGVPPSKNNFIRPKKRPVSSMTPTIFTDKSGRVRLILGASGGTKITTAIACVAIGNLWFGQSIKDAIDARRIHHQIYPMEVQYEREFNPRIIESLQEIGHKTNEFAIGTSIVQGIAVAENGTIFANADFRKHGTVAGF